MKNSYGSLLVLMIGFGIAAGWIAPSAPEAEKPSKPLAAVAAVQQAPSHPLNPLSAKEIVQAVKLARRSKEIPEDAFFPVVTLKEPSKEVVVAREPSAPFPRKAFVVAFDRPKGRTFEVVVDLRTEKVTLQERKGVQPWVLIDEFVNAGDNVRGDKRWKQAMRDRNIKAEQLKDIVLDSWATGPVPGHEGKRLIRFVPYLRGKKTHQFPHVIEGVIALVDMNKKEVVEVLDERPIVPIPAEPYEFLRPERVGPQLPDLKPLRIVQPEGADFTIVGNEIRWDKWSFRYSYHPREGLVLHNVAFRDGNRDRSILYRASLSEMLVPYGDPSKGWFWRNAFDVGEYGLGTLASPQRKGHEAPNNATVLPAVLPDENGKAPELRDGVIAVYEQDGGILWTHTDFLSEEVETRRNRQLVLQTLYTVGNYDYALLWIFSRDGGIEVRIDLTGIVLVKGVDEQKCRVCRQVPDSEGRLRPTGADKHGTLVAPGIVATNHQHFFSFRLDFDVDGKGNTVREMELVPEAPIASNPERNAFVLNQRQLRTEREARRDVNYRTNRRWKVLNPNLRTALDHYPAYELIPGTNALPLAHPDATVRRRGGFVGHHLWVTRHKPNELYAAGDYPNQSGGGDGLPRYGDDNESLLNQDVVVWYTLGVSHAPRAEEWPVMPVARAGFRLVPHNFFAQNPALVGR